LSSGGGASLPQPGGERDLTAQQVRPGALELVERPRLGRREQVDGLAEPAGLQAGPGRGQRALGPARGVGGESMTGSVASARAACAACRSSAGAPR
jgi:hypothetical protein